MGCIKNHLLELISEFCQELAYRDGERFQTEHQCQFAEDALLWAFNCGLVRMTGNLSTDKANIVQQYDVIVDSYQQQVLQRMEPEFNCDGITTQNTKWNSPKMKQSLCVI